MSVCPFCGCVNTPGVDECVECQGPLTDLHLHQPTGPVEEGVISDRLDAVRFSAAELVSADTPVSQVLTLMAGETVGCVLIGDDTGIHGIFSERDVLMRLGTRAAELGDHPVSEFMTPSPECLQKTAKVAFALHRMDLGGYRHVPVCDENGRVLGVISIRNILRYLTDRMDAGTR